MLGYFDKTYFEKNALIISRTLKQQSILIVRSCFEMVHEKIYEDVLRDFNILMKAHRGSYVTEEGWKKPQNRT